MPAAKKKVPTKSEAELAEERKKKLAIQKKDEAYNERMRKRGPKFKVGDYVRIGKLKS